MTLAGAILIAAFSQSLVEPLQVPAAKVAKHLRPGNVQHSRRNNRGNVLGHGLACPGELHQANFETFVFPHIFSLQGLSYSIGNRTKIRPPGGTFAPKSLTFAPHCLIIEQDKT